MCRLDLSLLSWNMLFLVPLAIWVTPVGAQQNLLNVNEIPDAAVSVLNGTIKPSTFVTGFAQQQPRNNDKTRLSAKKVNQSIAKAVSYIWSQQNEDGSWQKCQFEGDTTALCTLALINAGESLNSDQMRRALASVQNSPRRVTYVVSLRIMALAAADPKGKKYLRDIEKDVNWLLEIQRKTPGDRGLGSWNYGHRGGEGDGSNSQFALLALHEASRAGIKIPAENWQMAREFWIKCYRPRAGGFGYYANRNDVVGSMTCAGISSWIIINENLADAKALTNGEFAKCCEKNPAMEMVETAFKWMARYYTVQTNPGKGFQTRLYYLYGLERAARLAGRRFIGPNDWYRDGAKHLLRIQNANNGNWFTRKGHGEDNKLVATSFALLFLSKGKRPVAIGKYDHGVEDWDLHPKGIHYLTRRLETEWKTKLNWQTVRAEGAIVDDLLETPVLFMSGKDAIGLKQSEKDTLRSYLENGGFLFGEAYDGDGCGKAIAYDKAFRELMKELFPGASLGRLDKAHPIWNAHFNLLWNDERPLLGLQACCRTSVVYCPTNLSCYWGLDQPAVMDDATLNVNLRKRIDYCSQLGVNVVAYATGRDLKEKGETPRVIDKKFEMLTDRVLVFPKLQHGGGADDAPNAWRHILKHVETTLSLDMKTEKKLIAPTFEALADHPFVFVHGRSAFAFTDEQREVIRDSLKSGGFIFADSICASQDFTESFRSEMKEILGEPLRPIDPGHEIWTSPRFGYTIDQVTLRIRDPKVAGGFREEVRRPELEGAEIGGRLAVIFSPNDLSCALENVRNSQCTGYTNDDAKKIGFNVILYYLLSD